MSACKSCDCQNYRKVSEECEKAKRESKEMREQPVLVDGKTFVELLFQKVYDPQMYQRRIARARYHVPNYSLQEAMDELIETQRRFIEDTLEEDAAHFSIYETFYEYLHSAEPAKFVSLAFEFQKQYPDMVLEVSSSKIWELYRIGKLQKDKVDMDLL